MMQIAYFIACAIIQGLLLGFAHAFSKQPNIKFIPEFKEQGEYELKKLIFKSDSISLSYIYFIIYCGTVLAAFNPYKYKYLIAGCGYIIYIITFLVVNSFNTKISKFKDKEELIDGGISYNCYLDTLISNRDKSNILTGFSIGFMLLFTVLSIIIVKNCA